MNDMDFDQKIQADIKINQQQYLRDMQAYNDDVYFSCYAKNHIGKTLTTTPGDSLINKAKEIKNHAK